MIPSHNSLLKQSIDQHVSEYNIAQLREQVIKLLQHLSTAGLVESLESNLYEYEVQTCEIYREVKSKLAQFQV